MSRECDKSSFIPKSKWDEYTSSDFLVSPKDDACEHMKTHLFTFIINKISFGRDILDKIRYYPFVKHHKQQFIMKYCREYKISNEKIVREWYTDIIKDKINWSIVLEAIEAQINISDAFYITKPEMKKFFTSYANDVTDLIIVLDF